MEWLYLFGFLKIGFFFRALVLPAPVPRAESRVLPISLIPEEIYSFPASFVPIALAFQNSQKSPKEVLNIFTGVKINHFLVKSSILKFNSPPPTPRPSPTFGNDNFRGPEGPILELSIRVFLSLFPIYFSLFSLSSRLYPFRHYFCPSPRLCAELSDHRRSSGTIIFYLDPGIRSKHLRFSIALREEKSPGIALHKTDIIHRFPKESKTRIYWCNSQSDLERVSLLYKNYCLLVS